MKQPIQYLGSYILPNGKAAVGDLRIEGPNTILQLHSDEVLTSVDGATCIEGTSYTGERVTLLDCISHGSGVTGINGEDSRYHASVFPHYVAIGRSYIKPDQAHISSIQFTTSDLTTLFYDFDAFSSVVDAKSIIDTVLQERRRIRPVEAGERPQVLYFTGKDCIAEVSTAIGKVSVHHCPSYSMGGPTGIFMKNRIVVSIDPESPIVFDEAVGRMYDVANFLSVVAGRVQSIEHVHVTTTEVNDDITQSLAIHPSLSWGAEGEIEKNKPHPGDVPLDPIRRYAEFDSVLTDWISRHSGWRVARSRYLECIRQENKYGPDRLVAAANMFDILPIDAIPLVNELPKDLAATRDACVDLFSKHARGIDRDSALSSLKRLGKPSLPKKVNYRVSIVASKLGGRFPDLDLVASTAVKCRNYFVHGSSGNFDYSKMDPLVPFFTNALEFIFATSDLIESGWDAQRWNLEMHGWGHSFARFRSEYDASLAALRRALAK